MKIRNIFKPRNLIFSLKFKYYKKFNKYKQLADLLYTKKFGKKINWQSPEDLNQWINYLEFNTDTSKWSLFADKYRVRDYIKEKGYEDLLVPILSVWDSPDRMNFSNLPDSFILKMNNGSGDSIIVKNKNEENLESIKNYFEKKFNIDFAKIAGEPHYSRIKPVIIAEQLLDITKQSIKTSSLIDYKVWAFNGNVESIWVCYDRRKEDVKVMTYDLDWNAHPEWSGDSHHYLKAEKLVQKPKNLTKMIEVASNLSIGFPQMRIDFYEVDGKLYFGEITMTSNAMRMDFYSSEYLIHLGTICKKEFQKLRNI